jgi:phosphatidylglycerophosphate synthase
MLDPYLRPFIDPPLNYLGKKISQAGLSANFITLTGFLFGGLAMAAIAHEKYFLGLGLFLLNRFCDGIDGAIARHSKLTDLGGYLDIVCDFIIYAGMVFAFAFVNAINGFWAAFLIFSFIGPMVSFLAYAIIAAKHQHTTEARGKKSFFHAGGICEGSETFIFLGLMCIFPQAFRLLALIFGTLCWATTIQRLYYAARDFKNLYPF